MFSGRANSIDSVQGSVPSSIVSIVKHGQQLKPLSYQSRIESRVF